MENIVDEHTNLMPFIGNDSPKKEKVHSLIVNVKDFGTLGDGVTEDGPAFQNALNATNAKFFFVPNGNYLVSQELIFPDDCEMKLFPGANIIFNGPSTIGGLDVFFFSVGKTDTPTIKYFVVKGGKIKSVEFDMRDHMFSLSK